MPRLLVPLVLLLTSVPAVELTGSAAEPADKNAGHLKMALVNIKSVYSDSANAESNKANIQANLKRHFYFIDALASQGVEFVGFPELSVNGYHFSKTMTWLSLDGPEIKALQKKAIAKGIYISVGVAERDAEGKTWNTQIVIDPQGRIISRHRKIYLTKEKGFTEAGSAHNVFEVKGLKMGIATCADGSDRKNLEALVKNGAQIIYGPHANTTGGTTAGWYKFRAAWGGPDGWIAQMKVYAALHNHAALYNAEFNPPADKGPNGAWASGAWFIGPNGQTLAQMPSSTNRSDSKEFVLMYNIPITDRGGRWEAMKIHIREGDIHLLDLRTRIPFKYGIATMTETPHAFVRLRVEVDGQLSTGIAADHLPPKWFTKDPARPIDEEIAEMLRVIRHARQVAVGVRADTPFDAWREIYDAQGRWGQVQNLPPLLTHFGTSLVERALIDAVCRKLGQPFAEVLRGGDLGLRVGEIHLLTQGPEALLPPQPLGRINVRHTVGLADPLEDEEFSPDRPDDGLPLSLADCIRAYGLQQFKIKVSGHLERDLDRLSRVAQVVKKNVSGEYLFSLDGNEQFHSFAEFRTFFEALSSHPHLRAFFSHLAFVEQPLHRDVALQPAVGEGLLDWPQRPPIIIDESDGELDSLPQALRLGYAGTSHKNCKGVFKGIANRCLLAQLTTPTLMTGEDLANIGPVALLQDLAVCATLGLASVERNGHHYFAGLSGFPAEVQQQILAAHPDLYHRSRDGWPTLTIHDGAVRLDSVVAAPFGVAPLVDVELFMPVS